MYDYATIEKLTADEYDEIARITLTRFRSAAMWQGSEQVGGGSLRSVMRECYDQYNGILACKDRDIAEALGVDAYINLTAMKVNVVRAFLGETIIQADAMPWTIAPTPIPELSNKGRQQVLEMVKEELFGKGFSGDLLALTKTIKAGVKSAEEEYAADAAKAMQNLMYDQCVEGGWNKTAMPSGLTEFVTYPFGVLHGPIPTRAPRLTWSEDKIRTKVETFYKFEAPSIWDFWYSPDSSTTQNGAGVFLRQRWTRQQLMNASRMKSYVKDNVDKILEECENEEYNFYWLSQNPDQPDSKLVMWVNGALTVDVLIHYGFFSGRELRGYGFGGLDDVQQYNCAVTLIRDKVIQVIPTLNPTVQTRPIFTASFYKTRDRIPCFGVAQMLRDVERCYMASLRYLMRNGANAAEPITEVYYTRLAMYMRDEDIATLTPGGVYIAESGLTSQSRAMNFYSIPSNQGAYLQVMQYFMEMAHYVTNIPAALHGTAVGSGANRTFRGAAMLQGNAVKSIQEAVNNLDTGWFGPISELLFNYNMLYEKDESIKGDCQVIPQGVKGMLAKELNRNNSMEVLQLMGAIGNQMGPNAPAIFAWAVNNLFEAMGMPADLRISDMGQPAQAPSPQAAPAGDMNGPPMTMAPAGGIQ